MCGRFTLHHSSSEVAQRFGVQQQLFEFPPRYNVAPGQPIAVVTQNAHGDNVRALEGYRWGLVPSWAKDDAIGSKLINARLETLSEKPSFKVALKRRRCLIPADGFYEWKQDERVKTPHHIRFRDGKLFAFAGLWEEWIGPGDAPLRTCTIITGPPNELLATLHHRMAVILPRELENEWLDPRMSDEDALELLQIYPPDELEAFRVSRKVGNVVYDEPSLIAPASPDEENADDEAREQLALF